ncbi:monoamine oxidase [Stutzerimonas stutzeri]|nr:monoamine oxidase [Stutzerimonas stutzeri]
MAEHENGAKGVSRRKFLHGVGVGAVAVAGAGVVTHTTAASGDYCKTAGCDYDVVVIGGGFAGVTAARDSRKNGYKTLLLEARNRLGGRTFTSEFDGHKVEMGGTWIHQAQPFVWAEKERYGLEVLETPVSGVTLEKEEYVVRVGDTTHTLSGEQLLPLYEALDAFYTEARQVWDRPFDAQYTWNEIIRRDKRTAKQRLDELKLNPVQRVAIDSFVGATAHSPLDQASYVDMLRYWALSGWNLQGFNDAVVRYKLKDGTVALINKMIEDGKPQVRLSTPVKKIEDKGDHTVVTTQKGEKIVAATVIIALPMNVLPNLEFSPALAPALIEAGKQKHTGQGIKFYIKAKGGYTKSAKVTAMADSTYPVNLVMAHYVSDDYTLFVAFGNDPGKVDIYDVKAVQSILEPLFPGIQVESTHGYEWTLDPYSLGTYASYKPEWFEKYYAHFQKDSGRIFFGQGDHGEGWRGCIDGAIAAGGKAAQRTKELLG